MQYCIEQYKSRFNIEVNNDRQKALLLKKCREAKHQLTNGLETVIDEDSLSED